MQTDLPPQPPARQPVRGPRNALRVPAASLHVKEGELRRVLVAVDFSVYAERTLVSAGQLPFAAGAEVHLVHALEAKAREPEALAELESLALRELRQRAVALERAVERAGRSPIQVKATVLKGAAEDRIPEEALHVGAELIVVGRHGRRRFGDSLLGATAERIVRNSRLPVLVVQRRKAAAWQHPLVAVDLEGASPSPLPRLQRFCPEAPRVDVVHVYDTSNDLILQEAGASAGQYQEYEEALRRGAEAALTKALAAAALPPSVAVKPRVQAGDPRSVILAEARACRSDLLVLGTHARRGLAHFLMGSVAESVLRHAPCDVLLLPPSR